MKLITTLVENDCPFKMAAYKCSILCGDGYFGEKTSDLKITAHISQDILYLLTNKSGL